MQSSKARALRSMLGSGVGFQICQSSSGHCAVQLLGLLSASTFDQKRRCWAVERLVSNERPCEMESH